jgi:hypothetical protein
MGGYPPTSIDPFTNGSIQAAELKWHYLSSYLLSVVSADTLRTVEVRLKRFDMSEDPTDPNAGELWDPDTTEFEYNRVKPTDEFLTQ